MAGEGQERFPIMSRLRGGQSDFAVGIADFLAGRSPVPLFDRPYVDTTTERGPVPLPLIVDADTTTGAPVQVDDFDRTLLESLNAEVEPIAKAWDRFESEHPDRAEEFVVALAGELQQMFRSAGLAVAVAEVRPLAVGMARTTWAASEFALEGENDGEG